MASNNPSGEMRRAGIGFGVSLQEATKTSLARGKKPRTTIALRFAFFDNMRPEQTEWIAVFCSQQERDFALKFARGFSFLSVFAR